MTFLVIYKKILRLILILFFAMNICFIANTVNAAQNNRKSAYKLSSDISDINYQDYQNNQKKIKYALKSYSYQGQLTEADLLLLMSQKKK